MQRNSAMRRSPGPNTVTDQTWVVRAEMVGAALAADRAVARGRQEVALQLDGGEVLRPIGQVGDARVAGSRVGEQDHAGRVQVAVRREHPRLHRQLGVEPAFLDPRHDQAEAAGQAVGLALVQRLGGDIGSQHRGLSDRRGGRPA